MEQENWIIEIGENCIRATAPNVEELLELGKSVPPREVSEDLLSLSDSEIQQLAVDSQLNIIRNKRNKLLLESDWTEMISNSSLSENKRQEWSLYRQSLRDITENISSVNEALMVEWPVKPQ